MTDAPLPTSATGEPTTGIPDATTGGSESPWELYCQYINDHGGNCDPVVDMFPDLAYPGRGFVVHEWGTDTAVLASDGQQLRGLHHEEEDLPAFVYDRMSGGTLPGSVSAHVKMETPVTYFYSDVARSAAVSVGFPGGVFTQWYPAVAEFAPKIAASGAIAKLFEPDDPVMNIHFPFVEEMCREQYAVISDGLLDWGEIKVLAPGAEAPLPEAPLADFTWGYAREVAANLVRVAGVPGALAPQHERFLFYRGLGTFPLPLEISGGSDSVEVDNPGGSAIGRLFIVHVDGERGAFTEWAGGVEPGQSLSGAVPSLLPAPPLDLFADALAERVTEALDEAGLYHDEALAMVATWQRQWFRAPGLRALYLVPQAWTDESIPLTVAPAPEEVVRVMMIRAELLTVAQEQIDVEAAGQISDPDTAAAGKQHFLMLRRFAEPRLRRASALLGEPAYLADFIAEIERADTRVSLAE